MKTMLTRLALSFLASALVFAQEAPAPPAFRLPDTVRPLHYSVELKLVPTEDTFTGTVTIDLDVRAAQRAIWMHGRNITVERATLEAGGATAPVKAIAAGEEFLGFVPENPVQPGKARLTATYSGKVNPTSSDGIFKNKDRDDWYLYTQFESTDARAAFPCFDEPGFKTPWQLTLRVKKEHSAFFNQPMVSETDAGGGFKNVKFAETKPLSSYQVAFAVGPFESVDAGRIGVKRVPLRIIVPKGHTSETKWAVEVTGPILAELEKYFGIPFPYDKLDSIAVPLFGGAMENPGLITYGQSSIIAKPEDDTLRRRRGYASVAAHEMAHLWFGDLVTMQWWDDLWLNESFATWMSSKLLADWKPEWDSKTSAAGSRLGAMNADSLVTARKIRQPVQSKHDIANAFDGITYGKGGAVIHMFEHWIGPDVFRKGVRRYLEAHAYGNATTADFLSAISAAAGRDIAPAFSSFLDQPGVPAVSVAFKCEQGKAPVLALAQKRYMPLGSKAPGTQTWQIPVCFAYGAEGKTGHQCALFNTTSAEVPITTKACPEYVLLNDEYAGYFRSKYESGLLSKLLGETSRLDAGERLGIVLDTEALVRNGDVAPGEALALVPRFAGDSNWQVASSAAGIASGIHQHLVPDELRPNYRRFLEKMFADRARQIGWMPKPGESDETKLLRPALLYVVTGPGEDPALREQAAALGLKWLDDHKSVPAEVAPYVLTFAARQGDIALWQRMLEQAKQTKEETERSWLINAMGAFKSPEIVKKNFEVFAGKTFDPRQSFGLLFAPLQNPETRNIPFEYVKAHYDEVAAAMPGAMGMDFRAFLPAVGSGFCSEEKRAEVETFFKPRAEQATGGPRMLAQVLEQIRQCDATRAARQAAVGEFLKSY